MDDIICCGGDIGSSTAQVLTAGGDAVTVIESDDACAGGLSEHLDLALINGSASSAEVLRRAGIADADPPVGSLRDSGAIPDPILAQSVASHRHFYIGFSSQVWS